MQVATDSFIHGTAPTSNFTETEGIRGPDGLRISQVSYVKVYRQKGMMGTGEVQLQYRYATNGDISFVGYELFSGGVYDGNHDTVRRGSFVLDTTGHVNPNNGVISATQILNSGSCSTEFVGVTGKGSYVIAGNGLCSFEFSIDS